MRSSIAAIVRSRKSGSHSLSGAAAYRSPYSAASDGPDRLQIVARIKALADLADVLAERLAVAKVRRTRERIDLRARVIDIIFLGDAEPRSLEQPREAVSHYCAAAMAHMERTRRVGRDIFDVHPLVRADLRQAVLVAFAQDRPKLIAPRVRCQTDIDKARPCDFDGSHGGQSFELRLDRLGKRPRVRAGALGEHHRCIGREIAMRWISGRLDRDVAALDALRQRAFANEFVEHSVQERGILGVEAQFVPPVLESVGL